MGICLDTEQNNEELETTGGERSRRASSWAGHVTPPAASFPMQNSSHVKFEPPHVPVIFVLGGPGSGKVTHCDNLMQEHRGLVHINMTDLLQQYAIGNDMQDFGTLSSKTVTEVLMLEMKMAPAAKSYLVSGYPRSMRDVAEYMEKIQTVSGAVLVNWRQRVLERQIEYGARLGHVVLRLARMELANFYRRVLPAADYFDRAGTLLVAELIKVRGAATETAILWVVGGPGSNKAALCQRAVVQRDGWTHFSMGQRLRSLAEGGGVPASDGALSRAAVGGGELAPDELVQRLVRAAVVSARAARGLVLDGYPRGLHQLERFESEFGVSPRMVLLDCSKLQLGRARRDDSVGAFRRRLEVFRELSLPMLKTLDQHHRLVIVDGDTDSAEVQEEFTRVLLDEMEKAEEIALMPRAGTQPARDAERALPQTGPPPASPAPSPVLPNGAARAPNGTLVNGFAHIANNKIKPLTDNGGKVATVSQLAYDTSRLYRRAGSELSIAHHM